MGINREKSVQVWAVLDKETYAQLKAMANEQERTISKQAAYIIKEYLINHQIKK
jgi:hypothetical protein